MILRVRPCYGCIFLYFLVFYRVSQKGIYYYCVFGGFGRAIPYLLSLDNIKLDSSIVYFSFFSTFRFKISSIGGVWNASCSTG